MTEPSPWSARGPGSQAPPVLTILLIDDDDRVREVVRLMLETLGHQVQAFNGGEPALAWLSAGGQPDCALTDLQMPGMDGWHVLEAIRLRWPDLPVGIVTGTPEALEEARADVAMVLLKPVVLHELRAALHQLQADGVGTVTLGGGRGKVDNPSSWAGELQLTAGVTPA